VTGNVTIALLRKPEHKEAPSVEKADEDVSGDSDAEHGYLSDDSGPELTSWKKLNQSRGSDGEVKGQSKCSKSCNDGKNIHPKAIDHNKLFASSSVRLAFARKRYRIHLDSDEYDSDSNTTVSENSVELLNLRRLSSPEMDSNFILVDPDGAPEAARPLNTPQLYAKNWAMGMETFLQTDEKQRENPYEKETNFCDDIFEVYDFHGSENGSVGDSALHKMGKESDAWISPYESDTPSLITIEEESVEPSYLEDDRNTHQNRESTLESGVFETFTDLLKDNLMKRPLEVDNFQVNNTAGEVLESPQRQRFLESGFVDAAQDELPLKDVTGSSLNEPAYTFIDDLLEYLSEEERAMNNDSKEDLKMAEQVEVTNAPSKPSYSWDNLFYVGPQSDVGQNRNSSLLEHFDPLTPGKDEHNLSHSRPISSTPNVNNTLPSKPDTLDLSISDPVSSQNEITPEALTSPFEKLEQELAEQEFAELAVGFSSDVWRTPLKNRQHLPKPALDLKDRQHVPKPALDLSPVEQETIRNLLSLSPPLAPPMVPPDTARETKNTDKVNGKPILSFQSAAVKVEPEIYLKNMSQIPPKSSLNSHSGFEERIVPVVAEPPPATKPLPVSIQPKSLIKQYPIERKPSAVMSLAENFESSPMDLNSATKRHHSEDSPMFYTGPTNLSRTNSESEKKKCSIHVVDPTLPVIRRPNLTSLKPLSPRRPFSWSGYLDTKNVPSSSTHDVDDMDQKTIKSMPSIADEIKEAKFRQLSSYEKIMSPKPFTKDTIHVPLAQTIEPVAKQERSLTGPFQIDVLKSILGIGLKVVVTAEGQVMIREIQKSSPLVNMGKVQ
jgi:hypothetical protein